ncbi:FliM/FliN family flagellar motor switch protein [Heliomarina baculiformis]|uniref:FliM/FliN family flagellar motor switch protein n=1 Tax=Heliomarina baculiformis TaxID=2872036 RepID=UPI001EE23E92|nr:FliM/FliN family flagellar motor switch protein [Heliomarina baculiformis]
MAQTQTSPQIDTSSSERVEELIIRSASTSHQRLPVLEVLFDRFALALGPVMKSYCSGTGAEASLESFEYMSCGAALESLPTDELPLVVSVLPWGAPIGVVIDPKLLFTTLEINLGGRMVSQSNWTPRAYSAIEKRLGIRLCETVLYELTAAFSQVSEIDFEIERAETSPHTMVLAQPAAACIKLVMKIVFEDDRGGVLTFVLPHSSFEEIRHILAQPFRGGQLGGDSSWRELITETLSGTDVTVDAVLHEPEIQLHDILGWKPGQVVDLGIQSDQEVTVSCAELKMFNAAVGHRRNGAVALRVTRDFSEKEEPTDVAFD